jgi:hypothetical protein
VRTEAEDAAGEHEIEIAANPTGRSTVFPAVRPVVTATNFCSFQVRISRSQDRLAYHPGDETA